MAPPESERTELRELQRKAYGRDGGLTDAEARRLRELERAAAAPPAPQATAMDADGAPASEQMLADDEAVAFLVGASDQGILAESAAAAVDGIPAAADHSTAGPHGGASGIRALLRAQWHVVTVAAVVLLAIGVGAGWALFGTRSDDIPLTGEQQQRKGELYEKGGYDEGSVRAIGQDDDALVWYGTRNDGENVCLVLDVGAETGQSCQRSDDLSTGVFGLSAVATIPGEGESSSTTVMAYLMYSTSGVPLVSIQRWDDSGLFLAQFAGEERERAEELVDGEQAMNLAIVGYFRDAPVWLIDRWSGGGSETCLIVDGAAGQSTCRPSEDALSDGIAVYVSDDEVVPGQEIDASTIWSLEVDYTPNQTPYLTIIRDPESISVSTDGEMWFDGSQLGGGDDGDSIDVVPPSTDAKG
ncbi:hypothetical protein [Microbacterium sp. NPDC087591]|uniref:hypothetical protein n=1 Tax=Microbacterium sp. NPDC087591 TaxID=3364192 RepID=UPI003805C8C8